MTVLPERKRMRLVGFDYSSPGYYFITICTRGRRHLFGEVEDDALALTEPGRIVTAAWAELSVAFPHVSGDSFVAMPNHIHGIVVIERRTTVTLSSVVRALKAKSSRRIRKQSPGTDIWQRGFYDHVIRDEDDLRRIREYVHFNPVTWASDRENAKQSAGDGFQDWLSSRTRILGVAHSNRGRSMLRPSSPTAGAACSSSLDI